jgi:beta-lactamase regulating signal transducer with metallopeptidase domain
MAVEAVFWFHPLVWWIGSRMVEERELACDEEVLRIMYATQYVSSNQ